jgi:predicted amidohydrolase YtcJ
MGLEDDYGSISPGKYANFTILSHNPLTIDPLLIKSIKIKGTSVEGRLFKN